MSTHTLPLVSFIIPTLDAQNTLEACLKAIRSQNYPSNRIEILIADGGSIDQTLRIAKKYNAIIINNPDRIHEAGKSRASQIATGKIFFYIDADNILSTRDWINLMVLPILKEKGVIGLLPQTIPPPTGSLLNQYFSYLFTDPFTWFIYGDKSNPQDYQWLYTPIKKTSTYTIFSFKHDTPLLGLSQGVGTLRTFRRTLKDVDDILLGMKLAKQGYIAYVPQAGVYHYHVTGFSHFIQKYRARIQNNLTNSIPEMGLKARRNRLSHGKKIRIFLFPLYGLTLIFPVIDAIALSWHYHNLVMIVHVPASFILALLISTEIIGSLLRKYNTHTYDH